MFYYSRLCGILEDINVGAAMSQERLFPCCDGCGNFYPVKLTDLQADSYDDNVNVNSDGEPEIDSFESWKGDDKDLENKYHSCNNCGSDS